MLIYNCGYSKRIFFNLNDLLERAEQETDSILAMNQPSLFKNVVKYFYPSISDTSAVGKIINNSMINKLFCEFIYLKHANSTIEYIDCKCDNNPTNEQIDEMYKYWLSLFFTITQQTTLKYSKLIDIYEDKKDKLMNPIKNSSESNSRFNDTPQDEGVYDDLTHATTTNHQKIENETETATMIQRIAEIENKLKDYYTLWANEFDRLFMEETL